MFRFPHRRRIGFNEKTTEFFLPEVHSGSSSTTRTTGPRVIQIRARNDGVSFRPVPINFESRGYGRSRAGITYYEFRATRAIRISRRTDIVACGAIVERRHGPVRLPYAYFEYVARFEKTAKQSVAARYGPTRNIRNGRFRRARRYIGAATRPCKYISRCPFGCVMRGTCFGVSAVRIFAFFRLFLFQETYRTFVPWKAFVRRGSRFSTFH